MKTLDHNEADPKSFLSDVQDRRRAPRHLEEGALAEGYGCDRETVIDTLNQTLTEVVCVLRYKGQYYMATGIHAEAVAAEFVERARQERADADLLEERIRELEDAPEGLQGPDGPDGPDGLATRGYSAHVGGTSFVDMIREDLIAERVAIESYSEMIHFVSEGDPAARQLLEDILALERDHDDDMKTLIERLPKN